MSEQEALKILESEWPQYKTIVEELMKDGRSLLRFLRWLESFKET